MNLSIDDLFPDEISDETAFHLVEFFMSLATELDSHYFVQIKRYRDDSTPLQLPEYLQNKPKINDSF